MQRNNNINQYGLYRKEFEHDSCGTGFIAKTDGTASYKILDMALTALVRLEHRGAAGSDIETGDGAGVLFEIPDKFFRNICIKKGIVLPPKGQYAVGMIFIPKNEKIISKVDSSVNEIARKMGFKVLFARKVPVNPYACGEGARSSMPVIKQYFFVNYSPSVYKITDKDTFILRKTLEHEFSKYVLKSDKIYIASLSTRNIVYKGMLHARQVKSFYKDLQDTDVETSYCLFHSRFSTNTFPSWDRAQPCRMIAHNGEINTLRCDENFISANEISICEEEFKGFTDFLIPFLDKDGSDSMKFDNCLELLTMSGRSISQALMMMIPGPWSSDMCMSQEEKAFYEYSSCLMPPWDGPAAMCFTDGRKIGAVLDRNGLRPARYTLDKNGILILASETGVADIPASETVAKGKLGPGQMILLDMEENRIYFNEEIKAKICKGSYQEWLDKNRIILDNGSDLKSKNNEINLNQDKLNLMQKAFGYTYEDININIIPMAKEGNEPIGSMGTDIPLAVLSDKPQNLFNYFKQIFAQVTNPPIDSLREKCVIGTEIFLGSLGSILRDKPENCKKIRISSPVLSTSEYIKLKSGIEDFKVGEINILYPVNEDEDGLIRELDFMVEEAVRLINEGCKLIILSDTGVTKYLAPIPSLLAVSYLHHQLINKRLRGQASIILNSFEPREVHHFACLTGYGCDAVHPIGAYASIKDLCDKGIIDIEFEKACENFKHAAVHGVVKVMSKMGISSIQGYAGAQIFEAVGLSSKFTDKYFTGTVTRVEGIGEMEIAKDVKAFHENAFNVRSIKTQALESGGRYQYRKNGENHLYNPQTIHLFQQAVRTGDYELYKEYSKKMRSEYTNTIRSLLAFKPSAPVPIEEVEPIESIMKRFKTGAMSFGSISQEAHECLAIAMNTIGGKSNSGEGGENPERFGTDRNSAIKQVASGRFGVTGQYLASASEIQIKIAQGAKPGEGGQLPGSKVYPWVARTRHSTPGVGLISPPPHHDIYSIEDLAQLIYDLKNANPNALINVKLVSETGVGTIAAGVAKGGADVILISGFDGGTGASPRTSIMHAGLPWEIGLSETHQTLVLNNLRDRVRLETDGKLMHAYDVAAAALLGAEEFGFATLPLVAVGCVMMRVCNLDTCPVGVATQNKDLRKRFSGKPEYVINMFKFIAMELREIMASLGFRTLQEMVGRSDMLYQPRRDGKHGRIDLSNLISYTGYTPTKPHTKLTSSYEWKLFLDTVEIMYLQDGVSLNTDITNIQRAVGTRIGSFVSSRYGSLPDGKLKFSFTGTAGQSFGAFLPAGIELTLVGDANDYVGKGLSGGRIIISPPNDAAWDDSQNIIAGNVVLYGATSGELYAAGKLGERFCVRNSGATAVCEGIGDHGCEYMTGGIAVILGEIGKNFGAGMSGGKAFIYKGYNFEHRINKEMVFTEKTSEEDIEHLKQLLEKHLTYTGSKKAQYILNNWEEEKNNFLTVIPHDYKSMLEAMQKATEEGYSGEELLSRAFELKIGAVK